jgi:hypothetical protein
MVVPSKYVGTGEVKWQKAVVVAVAMVVMVVEVKIAAAEKDPAGIRPVMEHQIHRAVVEPTALGSNEQALPLHRILSGGFSI